MISSNIWSQVINKPDNHKFGVYYMNDSSVVFNTNGLKFSSNDIPMITEIFKKADRLDVYCKTHVYILVEKLIDSVGNYKFTYQYNPENKLSAVSIYQDNEKHNIYIYNFNKMNFVDYLLKHRDEYYIKLNVYNIRLYDLTSNQRNSFY